MTDTAITTDSPAPPPRPISAIAKMRAWTEPSVRMWWLLAGVILAMMLIYAGNQLYERHLQVNLIEHGDLIQAEVVEGTGVSVQHLTLKGESVEADGMVTLQYKPAGSTDDPVQLHGTLDGRTSRIKIGEMVPIHMDPKDSANWTYRSEPVSIGATLIVGLAFAPLIPILFAIAFLKRKTILKTWREGDAALAIVTDCKQTPIAPLSQHLRCGLADGRDKRIRTVYVPKDAGNLKKGDSLWLILPRDNKGSPLALLWMT